MITRLFLITLDRDSHVLRELCWRASASSLLTISLLEAKYEARVRYDRTDGYNRCDDSSTLSQLSVRWPICLDGIHEEKASIRIDKVSPMFSIVTFAVGW